MKGIKKYFPSIWMGAIFEAIAIGLWLSLDNVFYLLNFSYIGGAIALGLALYAQKKPYARQAVQFAVGLYMLVYLGAICRENMQIEGFWFYLFSGVFEAAVIHYAVAKIFGPLIFGRGWCGYACWTAMVLDLLPFKTPSRPGRRWGWARYLTFAAALIFVGALFWLGVEQKEQMIWYSFWAGNALYYVSGVALAFVCRDNRAFCKYLCPVTVFLKPMSYPALFRIRVDQRKCVSCGKCERICPMAVQVSNPSRRRKNATECILCMKCVEECPQKALKL
jgi:ferredoxin-type protein NapH